MKKITLLILLLSCDLKKNIKNDSKTGIKEEKSKEDNSDLDETKVGIIDQNEEQQNKAQEVNEKIFSCQETDIVVDFNENDSVDTNNIIESTPKDREHSKDETLEFIKPSEKGATSLDKTDTIVSKREDIRYLDENISQDEILKFVQTFAGDNINSIENDVMERNQEDIRATSQDTHSEKIEDFLQTTEDNIDSDKVAKNIECGNEKVEFNDMDCTETSLENMKVTTINVMEECSLYNGLDSLDLTVWNDLITNDNILSGKQKEYLRERLIRVEYQATGKVIKMDLNYQDKFTKKDIENHFFKKDPENFTAKFFKDKLLKTYLVISKLDEDMKESCLEMVFNNLSNGAESCSLGLAEAADASLIYCLNMFNMINEHADLSLGIKMNELNEQLIEESIKGFSNMENHQRYYIKKKVGLISNKFIDDTMDQHIDYDYLENLSKEAVKAFDNYKEYILDKINNDKELRDKAITCLEDSNENLNQKILSLLIDKKYIEYKN